MQNDETALDIRDLTIGYDDEIVLENIDLRVMHGEFFGLIGPNGGGKSTLLKAILGLLPPVSGTIRVYGEPPEKGRKYVGYVPQFSTFDRDYPITVKEVVLMGRRRKRGAWPRYSAKDRKIAEESIAEVGLEGHENRQIGHLSGGQKQRVFIARALAGNPRMLLLDEPTASVDARIEESIYKLLQKLNRDMTIVLVTHDIGVISSKVDTVACINRHLFKNDQPVITPEMLEESYQCPVDLIAHGIPHRVLAPHDKGVKGEI